jgi:hypothetical protein
MLSIVKSCGERKHSVTKCNGLFSCIQLCEGCSFEKNNPRSCGRFVFQNTHPPFFSVFETSGDAWQVPSRVAWEKRINKFFWSRSLPMLTDFYFSREPVVVVPTNF